MRKVLAIVLALLVLPSAACAATLTADVNAVTVEMSDTLYGLFYEDINHAADGGLYAELLQNRSFEHQDLLDPKSHQHYTGWQFGAAGGGKGTSKVMTEGPLNANNPTYMQLTVDKAPYRVMNLGYGSTAMQGGVTVTEGEAYRFFVYLRNGGDYAGEVTVALTDRYAKPLSETVTFTPGDQWQKFECTLTARKTTNACLTIILEGTGSLDMDMASLLPVNCFGAHWPGGGLRSDLVQALMELQPRFLRFPGGCIAEGSYYRSNFYNWKDTVGPIEQRRENYNTWGYMQSYGIGFFEYFCLAEALGAEPLPVVHAGVLCQAREAREAPLTIQETQAYAQDILDLIEFATGDATTTWGALRAEMGHPEPFELNYIAIGNENWGSVYFTRYEILSKAVKEKYPDITCIVAAGPVAEGSLIRDSWNTIRSRFADSLVDEHYYMESQWLLDNVDRYDDYPRTTQVFLGEYAAHEPVVSGRRPNNLYSALCEAAYLTGIERNSDVVRMASYAPLLAREGMFQWTPDMIWFNARNVMLTPNYHVQKMFSTSLGDWVLESTAEGSGLYHVVTRTQHQVQVKVVSLCGEAQQLDIHLAHVPDGLGRYVQLSGDRRHQNSFADPDRLSPVEGECPLKNSVAQVLLPANSVTVLTFDLN